MTTVTEHRVIRKATDVDEMGNSIAATAPAAGQKTQFISTAAQDLSKVLPIYTSSVSVENMKNDLNATIIPKFNTSNGTAQAINGILKGGKLRNKNEQPIQVRKSKIDDSPLLTLFYFRSVMNRPQPPLMKKPAPRDRYASQRTTSASSAMEKINLKCLDQKSSLINLWIMFLKHLNATLAYSTTLCGLTLPCVNCSQQKLNLHRLLTRL